MDSYKGYPHMKKLFGRIAGACLLALAMVPMAAPAAIVFPNNINYVPNVRIDGINALNSTYTNATTTSTVMPGTQIVLPATPADYTKQYIRVCWSALASKATSTSGTIAVMLNGAIQSDSGRSISSVAGAGSISSCYTMQRSSAATQTVALYGSSGDTAAFTVTAAQISVERIFIGG